MTTSHSQRISCPNPDCPNPTRVQKVSGVVADGTASYVTTTLATKLSLPDEVKMINKISLSSDKLRRKYRNIRIILCIMLIPLCLYLYGLLFLGWRVDLAGFILLFLIPILVISIFGAMFIDTRNRIARDIIKALRPKWDQLYYCRSCDNVFLPRKPDFAPADQMMEFLKRSQ